MTYSKFDIYGTSIINLSKMLHHPGGMLLASLGGISLQDLAAIPGLVLPSELIKARPERQCEFLCGRLLAFRTMELCGYTAVFPGRLERAPQWSAQQCGSIAHTKGWVAAAVTEHHEVLGLGIDIESIMTDERFLKIRSKIINSRELKMLEPHPQGWGIVGTLVFSLKEAIFKSLNPLSGKFFDFLDVEIQSLDIHPGLDKDTQEHLIFKDADYQGTMEFCLCKDLSDGLARGMQGTGQFLVDLKRNLVITCYSHRGTWSSDKNL